MVTVAVISDFLDRAMPPALAADWDNVGLLIGERATPVTRVMTCLTVTPQSAAEAVEAGVQLIVTHHPIFFRPVQRITDETTEGRTLLPLMRAGIAVYSPHTAFDNAAAGINHELARRLGLTKLAALRSHDEATSFKIVVFVPESDLAKVSDAMFAAGAGKIGQYRECSYRVAGTGTFFGTEATNPAVGAKDRREEVSELRLEVVCPQDAVGAVVAAMRKAHSYEEPAYDVYPLKPAVSSRGEGRVGELERPIPLGELALRAKVVLHTPAVQIVGDGGRVVQRVAVACGAAGQFLADAARAGADVFVTGEMRFHDNLDAKARGVALLLPGHYATERFGVEELALRIRGQWPELEVWASRRESDPVTWV
jgi:dinuclear metal center YbgI/SA1388 family protein